MLQIAICDDHKLELIRITQLVKGFELRHPEIEIQIHVFESALLLLDHIKYNTNIQIYLLDIIMPKIGGIELGKQIREKDQSAIIIYLSSSPDYALKAFHVYAFQYLLKPLNQHEFYSVLDKSLDKIFGDNSEHFVIKAKDGITTVSCNMIIYVEYLNHIFHTYLSDGSIISSVTLREPFKIIVTELLKNTYFIKPHKSYLVNMNYVSMLRERDFIMMNHDLIPISRNNYAEVKKQYIDFLLVEKSGR